MESATEQDPGHGSLGACPDCNAELRATDVLICYETQTSDQRVFAECPDCRGVVHPA